MTTDTKELIELAAKAMGFQQHPDGGCEHMFWIGGRYVEWNPATNGQDSRSLQVALDIAVIPYPYYGKPKHSVVAKQYSVDFKRRENPTEVIERFCDHPSKEAAYCMAVLRCAAEIQRRKEL